MELPSELLSDLYTNAAVMKEQARYLSNGLRRMDRNSHRRFFPNCRIAVSRPSSVHAATAGSLILLGVGNEDAAAVSIVMHLVYFAPAIVFGLYYFFHGDISIERFRNLLSSENAVEEIESESPNSNGELSADNG